MASIISSWSMSPHDADVMLILGSNAPKTSLDDIVQCWSP